ncbi:MAG: DUF4825 domain-containing protein [Ruminococcaceae bacterium]|nr:DUF4825 domain-containing protein [Oscillospiraceae bacterium]
MKMNDLPCEVVRDLLPSYVDGLTSEATNRLVDGHIETCAPCRAALDAMRAPEEKRPEGEHREIDYLKKNRRHNRKVVLWSLIGALALAMAVIFMRFFVVGEELHDGFILDDIQVTDGYRLSARIDCLDSARVVKAVYYEDEDGVVTLHARGVVASFLYGLGARVAYEAHTPIRQVRTAERVYWDDGEMIGKAVSDIFLTYHDYVGDMSANNRTAEAIGLRQMFGPYTNELRTSEEPYRWTITLQNDVSKKDRYRYEDSMKKSAYLMIAMVGNLKEVEFSYTVDGVPAHQTYTAYDATTLLGQNVKDCAKSARCLSELMYSLP